MSYTSSGYQITLSDGTVLGAASNSSLIADFNPAYPTNLSDSSKTSLSLSRRGARNYADINATNFVHLLENFSNSTAPSHPLFGQLWFDKANNTLKLYDSTGSWEQVGAKSTGLQSAVTIRLSGEVEGNISFDGSTANSPYIMNTNLAVISTVNAGTYTNPVIEVDNKGRIKSARNGTTAALSNTAIINALGYTPVKQSGDTMSGDLTATNIDTTTGKIKEKGYELIPSGIIVMWSGVTIPNGWLLCDGTNGTPNLRDRFIVGSGNTYPIKSTGGFSFNTSPISNLNHTHSFTSDSSLGAVTGTTDAHALSIGEIPSHNHAWGISSTYPQSDAISGTTHVPLNLWSDNAGTHYQMTLFSDGQAITGSTGGSQGHTHTVSGLNLLHNHSGTTNNPSFSGTPSVSFDNRPPYFALAYIMKI